MNLVLSSDVAFAYLDEPTLIAECAEAIGNQNVVLSIDIRQVQPSAELPSGYEMVINGGRIPTGLEAPLRACAPRRLSWMTLLARVFRIDISICTRCSGPMRVTRAVTTPEQIAAELHGARPPPRPSPPGQLLLPSLA